MTRSNEGNTILKVSFGLLLFSSMEHGISSLTNQTYCFPNMKNMVVYEGTLNVPMNVTASPCNVAWSVFSTTDELTTNPIVGPGCSNFSMTDLYYTNGSGLTILNSTTTKNGHPLSTAGFYVAQCDGNNFGAKLLVVRSGPDCSCVPASSSRNVHLTLSCWVAYADYSTSPIPAIITWMLNGVYYTAEEPYRNKTDSYVYTATSTITVNGSSVDNYECLLQFGPPIDDQYGFIATNAPDFNASCTTPLFTVYNNQTAQVTTQTTSSPQTQPATVTGTPQYRPTAGAPAMTKDGLPEGAYIGIGVGIGAGGLLVLGGILVIVLCRRSQRIDKRKTDDAKTKRMEDDSERGRSHGDNSVVQNYEPLSLTSPQDPNYDQLTTSNNVNVTDQDTCNIYESCDETPEANEPREGGRRHGDNSAVQNYEPLKVPSQQDSNYDQLTTSTNVNPTDQDTYNIYESCNETLEANEPSAQPPSDEYDSIIATDTNN